MSESDDRLDPEQVEQIAEDAGVSPDILREAERAVKDVAGLEVDLNDAESIERLRQRLPKNPDVAHLTHAMMPPAFREVLEYVEPSDRQSGYWRRSRERRDPTALSAAELRHRIEFIESRKRHSDERGVTETRDGRRVAESALRTGDELRGEDYTDRSMGEKARERGAKLLSRFRDVI